MWHADSISQEAQDIPSCNLQTFEYNENTSDPEYPTLLFGRVYKNSKRSAKAAVGRGLDTVRKTIKKSWAGLKDDPSKTSGLHAFRRIIRDYYSRENENEMKEGPAVELFMDEYLNPELKNKLIVELKRQIGNEEIGGIAEDAVENMIADIFKYWTHARKKKENKKRKRKKRRRNKNTNWRWL